LINHRSAGKLLGQRFQDSGDLVGILDLNLDHSDGVASQQQRLRIGHRHHHKALVEIVDPDLEDRGDIVGDLARDRAKRGGAALRVDDGQ
jgi:hypothetical protein